MKIDCSEKEKQNKCIHFLRTEQPRYLTLQKITKLLEQHLEAISRGSVIPCRVVSYQAGNVLFWPSPQVYQINVAKGT